MPDGPRLKAPEYDDDFYAWTRHQAEVLRSMKTADNRFDRENVAEEIETLGRSERDTVRSQVRRIIEHCLKLQYSPAEQPRYGWMESIVEARSTLDDKISPTLRRDTARRLPKLYEQARYRASLGLLGNGEAEAASRLPSDCPYSLKQVLEDGWYPDPTAGTP
jgi:hypothetical protein